MRHLGTDSIGDYSVANDINNRGQIVGTLVPIKHAALANPGQDKHDDGDSDKDWDTDTDIDIDTKDKIQQSTAIASVTLQ